MKNMQTVLLAVKETEEIIQEGDGGIRYLTQADFAGAGGGGTGDASAANQTSVQAIAGSDASKAVSIQGITGGKPIPVTVDGVVGGFSPQEADNFEIGSFNGTGSYVFSTSNKGTLKLLIGVEAPTPPAIFLSAPILEVIANGTENWRPLEDIDPSYVPLTTDTVQSRVLDVTAYSSVRISFNVNGGIGYQATTSRLVSQVEVKRLLGNIATSVGNISGGSEQGLHIAYDNITNCPVSPTNSVAAWNTYLSTDVVTSVQVVGSKVILKCNGGFVLADNMFKNFNHLVEFHDSSGIIYDIGNNCFQYCEGLKHLTLNGIPDTKYSFCDTCQLLESVTLKRAERIGDSSFRYMQSGKFLLDAPIKSIGYVSMIGITTEVLNFLHLEHCDEFLSSIGSQVWKVNLPELKTAYRLLRNTGGAIELYASKLEVVTDILLDSPKSGFIWHLESLKVVGAGSFDGAFGISGTVYTNRQFATTNSQFLAFLAANPSVVVVYTDNNAATQTNQYLVETVCQTVAFTNASSTASAGFNANTKRILVTPTEDCWIKLGGTATAGGSSFFVSAGIPFPPILLNGKTSLSVIGKATSGQLSIFESL